jgi:hypothetical protein
VKSAAWLDTPMTFPPGRAKLATSPTPTGSATFTNTMGIVGVACLAARAAGAEWATMTSTLSWTNSATSAGYASFRPCDARNSIARFWPSV